MISRRPGEGRYAQLEREQRWLLRDLPSGVVSERVIVDHYWTGTSLRLRMVQDHGEVAYKLCQKVRAQAGNPETVKITNLYLDEREFRALTVTLASILSKSRWTLVSGGVTYAVDEFKGRHSGLVLAETELRVDEPRLATPDFALTDVTNDDQYSGGWLAAASDDDLVRIIPRSAKVGGTRGSR